MLAKRRDRMLVACLLLTAVAPIALPGWAEAECMGYSQGRYTDLYANVFYGWVITVKPLASQPPEQLVTLQVTRVEKGRLLGTLQMRQYIGLQECHFAPLQPNREYLIYPSKGEMVGYAVAQPTFTTERQMGVLVVMLGLLIAGYSWRAKVRRRLMG